MYINVKKHILSNAILMVAVSKIIAALCEGASRVILKKSDVATPDMLDIYLWHIQLGISAIQIIVTVAIFYFSWKKLNHYMELVPKDDQQAIGELQRQFLGKKNASLSVSSVNRLLQLWAVIFVGAELIYDFTSIMYRRFIAILMDALSSGTGMSDGTFIMLYNMTHGFKYLEILAAILLGVVMTAIFLNDRYLKITSLVILILFLISFGVLQMQTFNLMGREVGIVWTSIIYHATETLGLVILSIYLSKAYKGL